MLPTLSASRLTLFIECRRCFWLEHRAGIARPKTPFPTLPSGIDLVLKRRYDQYRAAGTLPPELDGHTESKDCLPNLNDSPLTSHKEALMATRAASLSSPAFIDEGYSYPALVPLVRQCLTKGVSVLLRGHPGCGKSSMAAELAAEMKLPMIDIRLAQKDPAELGGVYIPNREKKVLELYPPDWVQMVCDEPAFVFLDEINAAVSKLHQAAAYQIILEHRVGASQFHPQTVVMAAGNLEEDEALAVPLSSALQNRFVHFILKPDADAWIAWATAQGLSPDIVGYVAFRREPALYKQTHEYAYPTPRSWAMAATVDGDHLNGNLRKRLIAACVGHAAATEFQAFHTVYRQVDVQAILNRGQLPDFRSADPAFLYALCYAVGYLLRAKGLKKTQAPNLLTLFMAPAFTPEFQVLLLKCIQGSRAFTAMLDDPVFNPMKDHLVRFLTDTQAALS